MSLFQFYTGDQEMLIECPESGFFDEEFFGYSKLIVLCGPQQYRFRVYTLGEYQKITI